MPDWISLIYASSIGGGGVATFVKSGCPVALSVGLVCGGLAGYGSVGYNDDVTSRRIIQGVSLFHGILYTHRFYKSRKVVPAAIFSVFSLAILARSLSASGSDLSSILRYLNMTIDWMSYTYSLAVTSGGLIGYFKAGSTVSLGAGLLFGGLAGLGAYRTSADPQDIWLSLGVSSSLGVLMGSKFYKSGKFMPAGLTALLSAVIFTKCLYTLKTNPSQIKSD